ncbi:MAG TPA: AEC family transporter [Chloroflexota bacterium]|nr:AEC family transporter [Chloroflexota bacterium]
MERPIAVIVGLLGITLNVVAPVFLMAGVGFLVRRTLAIDVRAVARLALYIFVPSLLLNSLLTATMGGQEMLRIALFAVLLTAILIGLGTLAARAFGLSRSEASGMTLSLAFVNAANYGLPVTFFAFGQDGFDRAVIFAAFASILLFTVAVPVAAGGKLPWRDAVVPMVRLPVIWVAVAAGLLRMLGMELPPVIQRSVTVLSGGAIPIVIILLGMQVASLRLQGVGLPLVATCLGRLILSPAIGLVLVSLLQPSPLTGKVLVLEAAMPTAVNVTLLASEFDAEPDLVSSVALVTTALSVVTITGWVAFLQAL